MIWLCDKWKRLNFVVDEILCLMRILKENKEFNYNSDLSFFINSKLIFVDRIVVN